MYAIPARARCTRETCREKSARIWFIRLPALMVLRLNLNICLFCQGSYLIGWNGCTVITLHNPWMKLSFTFLSVCLPLWVWWRFCNGAAANGRRRSKIERRGGNYLIEFIILLKNLKIDKWKEDFFVKMLTWWKKMIKSRLKKIRKIQNDSKDSKWFESLKKWLKS